MAYKSKYKGIQIDDAVGKVIEGTLQDKLTAGDGIKIEGNVISADVDHSVYATKEELSNESKERKEQIFSIKNSIEDIPIESGSGQQSIKTKGIDHTADNLGSVALGFYANTASGISSVAVGFHTTASGYGSHAEGGKSIASADYAHAEGKATEASGNQSHSEGSGSKATDIAAHAEGVKTEAGYVAHAQGYETKATGNYSHSEGFRTIAIGRASHIEGENGNQKIPVGTSAMVSELEQQDSGNAIGNQSHVEGVDCTAVANTSHVGGYRSVTYGDNSFAHGQDAITRNSSEAAFGRNNRSHQGNASQFGDPKNTLFSVGMSGNYNTKRNAIEIMQNGDVYLNGIGEYDEENIDGSKSIQEVINGKQEKLTEGAGISISNNVISCTLDTTIFTVVTSLPSVPAIGDEKKIHLVLSSTSEESNTYDEYLWVNNSWERIGSFRPSVDLSRYAEKSYVDSQIEGEATARAEADAALVNEINGKQDALTLTVKDNGNIVLANIQGQSKEFMPATPSGDPMHYAYVAAGAEYNATGADIVRTDAYGNEVTHKAGYWYLNSLGDISNEEMQVIYADSISLRESNNLQAALTETKARTNITIYRDCFLGMWGGISTQPILISGIAAHSDLETLAFRDYYEGRGLTTQEKFQLFSSSGINFRTTKKLKQIIGIISCSNVNFFNSFVGCSLLEDVRLYNVTKGLSFAQSPNLSVKSILYIINYEAATSPITITLHADAYARAMANADILAALQAHTNVSLASV